MPEAWRKRLSSVVVAKSRFGGEAHRPDRSVSPSRRPPPLRPSFHPTRIAQQPHPVPSLGALVEVCTHVSWMTQAARVLIAPHAPCMTSPAVCRCATRLRRTPLSPTLVASVNPPDHNSVELASLRPTTPVQLDTAPSPSANMPALSSFLPRFYRHPSAGQMPHEHHPFTVRDVLASYGADWALAVFLWFFLSWFNRVEGYKREFSLEHDIRWARR